ncbi:MAG: hypothetical protein COA88_11795 [Kordia sp.]|nr:MAG: hypothetical protein COA88_11795 [Kordia sp.]
MVITDDIVEYVQALELAPPKASPTKAGGRLMVSADEVEPDPDKVHATLTGGAVLINQPGMSTQSIADVANSCTFAQRAADKKFPDLKGDMSKWFDEYLNVLKKIGWFYKEVNFQDFDISSKDFTMDKVVLSIAAAIYTGGGSLIVEATLKAVGAMADESGKLHAFKSESQSENQAKFQIADARETNGSVKMKMANLNLHSKQSSGTVLFFFDWKLNDASASYSELDLSLNGSLYSKVREIILDKLVDKTVSNVLNIDV